MNKFFLIIIVLFCSLAAGAQSEKRDYIWLGGYNYDPTIEGNENFIFDFKNGASAQILEGEKTLSFRGNSTSICDTAGNLLLYSNGCHIADSTHTIIWNGSGINESIWIGMIKDTCNDYPGFQDILLVNDPANIKGYYLVHKTIDYNNNEYYVTLKTSYINTRSDGSYYVQAKNDNILDTTRVLLSYLTAIHHQNGQDWWFTQPAELSNEILVIKLDGSGFELTGSYAFPFEYVRNSSASGSAKFSPDGTRYAYFNAYDNLVVYDFDRQTGELSNLRALEVLTIDEDLLRGGSVEWSPNSRFIYVCAHDDLWQIDTWADELQDGMVHIDSYDGGVDPFPTRFFIMALAPDCRIYMNSNNGSQSYHVINKPNELGVACDFVQQGIKLPTPSSVGTIPNFPRFRVDEDEKCDPTITSVFGDDIYWRRDLVTYPNPVRDRLTIELPEGKQGKLYVFDTQGQLVWQSTQRYHEAEISLDMSGFSAGTYSVEFVPEENKERRLWTSWVVKNY